MVLLNTIIKRENLLERLTMSNNAIAVVNMVSHFWDLDSITYPHPKLNANGVK